MKEATGELNMTVVTVVAIAALVAFFYLVIWPTIKTGMALNSACSTYASTGGTVTLDDGGTIVCTKKTATTTATCTYNPSATEGGKPQTKNCE